MNRAARSAPRVPVPRPSIESCASAPSNRLTSDSATPVASDVAADAAGAGGLDDAGPVAHPAVTTSDDTARTARRVGRTSMDEGAQFGGESPLQKTNPERSTGVESS